MFTGATLSCDDEPTAGKSPVVFSFIDSAFPNDTELCWGETGILQPSLKNGEKMNSDGWSYRVTREGTEVYTGTDTAYISVETTGASKGALRIQFTNPEDKYNNYIAGTMIGGSTAYAVTANETAVSGSKHEGTFTYALPNVGIQLILYEYNAADASYDLRFRFIPNFLGMFSDDTSSTIHSSNIDVATLVSDSTNFYSYVTDTNVFTSDTTISNPSPDDTDDQYGIFPRYASNKLRLAVNLQYATNKSYGITFAISIDGKDFGVQTGQSFVLPIGNIVQTNASESTVDISVDATGATAN